MFCKKCGTQLREGAAFCLNCGTKIQEANTGQQEASSNGNMKILPKEEAAQMTATPISESDKGKNKKKKIIPFISAGVVIIILIVAILVMLLKHEGVQEEVAKEAETIAAAEETGEQSTSVFLDETTDIQETEEPVEDDGIHRYEIIVADVTWTQACGDCLQRGGYLVHIDSQEEYDTILSQIASEGKDNIIFWLGGIRMPDSYEYRWLNADGTYGEISLNNSAPYSSYWMEGEPSFQGTGADGQVTDENCISMFYRSSEDRFVWNDVPDDIISVVNYYAGRVGYICEYED